MDARKELLMCMIISRQAIKLIEVKSIQKNRCFMMHGSMDVNCLGRIINIQE